MGVKSALHSKILEPQLELTFWYEQYKNTVVGVQTKNFCTYDYLGKDDVLVCFILFLI